MSTEKKPVILFIPQYLAKGFGFLSFHYVIKKGISIEYLPMNIMDLKSIHRSIPDEAFIALKSLSDPVIATQKNEFAKILKKSASSQNLEGLLHKKILRLINETFMQNLYHWKQLPWFHQTKDPVRKSIRKSPCSLQDAKRF